LVLVASQQVGLERRSQLDLSHVSHYRALEQQRGRGDCEKMQRWFAE
jgi:hypothetical protein